MMSEDEILDKVNYMINNWHRSVVEIRIEWIQGLLDLYRKEKEKNKELENADLTTIYLNGFYDGEKKLKDKIREKMEEVENLSTAGYEILKELLEENNGKQ